MTKHVRKEIDYLKNKILALSAMVEESVRKAVKSIQDRDLILAKEVIHGDIEVDDLEVEIAEDVIYMIEGDIVRNKHHLEQALSY